MSSSQSMLHTRGRDTSGTARFFAFARARHEITLRRAAGQPRPWTDDPILGTFRFTNVFRELDRTTVWIAEHVRRPLDEGDLEPWQQVLGVILARTFNRVPTLEQIFCQETMEGRPIGWAYLCPSRHHAPATGDLEAYMRALCPPPWVTGAYIVKTPDGMDKLRGALWIVDRARTNLGQARQQGFLGPALRTMEGLHGLLVQFPYLGGFTAYEIVTDLRHMAIGRDWLDVMTWAHAGPGAVRGLHRVHGRPHAGPLPARRALEEMRSLLELSRDPKYWPQQMMPIRDRTPRTALVGHMGPEWPRWEMREVEHTLCEFDKMERARLGQGRPRGVYR